MAHYDDVIMPITVRFGSISVPETDTQQVFKTSGFRKANSRRSRQQIRLQLIYLKGSQGIHDILKIWRAVKGPANTFLALDWHDWNTTDGRMDKGDETLITNADQPLKNTADDTFVGDGTTTTFQMVKQYAVGATAVENRDITKPISGTIKVAVDGVDQTEGVDFTVNYATGVVTFTAAPGSVGSPTAVLVTWGGQFRLPVHFLEDRGFVQRIHNRKANELPSAELLEAFLS